MKLESKHLFVDHKVATRFAHLRSSIEPSRGPRIRVADEAAGDLNTLRQERQHRWSECQCQFADLKEPDVGYEVVVDILSVMNMCDT
jgi:hypothetical protein